MRMRNINNHPMQSLLTKLIWHYAISFSYALCACHAKAINHQKYLTTHGNSKVMIGLVEMMASG